MKFRCYKNDEGNWAAHMVDAETGEPIGPEVVSPDHEISVFNLGAMYGYIQNGCAKTLDMINLWED